MRILVTGAHGLLGHSLLRHERQIKMIGCGRRPQPVDQRSYHQVELTDRRAITRLLAEVRPDWVIHTAALTDVDRCETERELAQQVNLESVAHLVEACGQIDAGLVQLSTDYVFDGQKGPYSEDDEPHPLSYYGALKLASESLVLESGIKGLVLRTLWLYGYIPGTRRNLVTWPLQMLSRGESVQAVDDQWGNPTYVHDLAEMLLELCQQNARGLFHMGGASYMTRYELVVQLAQFFGLEVTQVRRISTKVAQQVARRPLRSGLRTDALRERLGRRSLSFGEGLERMVREEDFRRDFVHLL
jgi:dTDP-4-dehydrorhamnose reductase